MVVTLVVVAAVATSAAAVRAVRRQRRQLQALMARLDELETALADREDAEDGLARVVEEVRSGRHPAADVLAGRTTHVRRLVEGEDGTAFGLADQAIVAVHRRLEDPIAPADLADELCVSLRTLERGLATTLECTPRQLILAMKMREARRLLEREALTVSEVAYRLGFSSPGHFSRRFSAFYREAPSAVRSRAAA